MVCLFARRAISRSGDRGEKPSRWVEGHAARCRSCREYARFAASLGARLSAERRAFLDAVPDFPWEKDARARPGKVGKRRRPFARGLALHALPAALVLAVGFVLFRAVVRKAPPTAEDRAAVLTSLRSISSAADGLPGVVMEAESSLDRERRVLERSLASALEYVQARLNIRIEKRESPRSL